MDDFSLARPVGHLIMWDGSGPDGLAEKDGAKALSGAESVDTATTQLDKPSRTKNLINELSAKDDLQTGTHIFNRSYADSYLHLKQASHAQCRVFTAEEAALCHEAH